MTTVLSSSLELSIELRTLDEVRVAQSSIRRFVGSSGFDRAGQWQVTIAASEAGTNMVKYGGGGRLTLRRIVYPRTGLRLEARDFGPGIADLACALEDHVSEGNNVLICKQLDRARGDPPDDGRARLAEPGRRRAVVGREVPLTATRSLAPHLVLARFFGLGDRLVERSGLQIVIGLLLQIQIGQAKQQIGHLEVV
jgi:serine/threonine-protein kinase RsbT